MPAEYGQPLSNRELELVLLVAEGLSNREIGDRLFLSPNTVKVHLRNIFTKTGVMSRTELTMLAVKEGWVTVVSQAATSGDDGDALASEPDELAAHEPAASALATDTSATDVPAEIAPLLEVQAGSIAPSFVTVPSAWPAVRLWTLAFGGVLALWLLLFPLRPAAQTEAAVSSGLVDANEMVASAITTTTGVGWTELSPLPARRGRLGLAALGGRLYAVGGMTDAGPTAQVDIYDIHANAWSSGAPRPLALANAGAVALGKLILVPGGCDAHERPYADTHLYDPAADRWRATAPLPRALCAYALTVHDEQVYLFGGWDGVEFRALAYRYDLRAETWAELPAPAVARGLGGAAALAERLYYVGGYDGQREYDTCEVYLPEENRWEVCPALLQARGGLGVVAAGNKLYAIGGGMDDYNYLGFNERYVLESNAWSVIETPLVGEWRNLGSVFWDTTLYAIGGRSGAEYLNRSYALEVLPWRIAIPLSIQE